MRMPVRIADLPARLQPATRKARDEEWWFDAIDAFENWLEDRAERPPRVLVMLAWMLYRDGIADDEVVELGPRVLALLDEAGTAKTLRAEVVKAIGVEKRRHQRIAKQPLESLDKDELRNLGIRLGGAGDHVEASRVWTHLAKRDVYNRDRYAAYAALSLADAGLWAKAKAGVAKILAAPDDHDDANVDSAWSCLLDRAILAGDVAAFRKHWNGATATRREFPFPSVWTDQEAYLTFAVDHGLADIAKHLVDVVAKTRKPRDRAPITALLERAAAMTPARGSRRGAGSGRKRRGRRDRPRRSSSRT